jgi:hypothetical protein
MTSIGMVAKGTTTTWPSPRIAVWGVGVRQRRANFLQQLGLTVARASLVAMEDVERHAEQDVDVPRRRDPQALGPGPDQQAILHRVAVAVVPSIQGGADARLLALAVGRLLVRDAQSLDEAREARPHEHPTRRLRGRRSRRQRSEEAQMWTRERRRCAGISPI